MAASIVSESPEWMSFNDINPQAPVHIVLIPKKHVENLSEFKKSENALIGDLLLEAERLTKEKKISDAGYRLVINSNQDGGQTVPHLHLHILGGRPMRWPPG